MWVLYVDYIRTAMGHIMQIDRHICSWSYANNVKCMYNSACGKTFDCSEFT